jgi:DICT domain-containing protein
VPWSKLKVGDIMNWPSDVKLMSVWQMNAEEVKRLHQLLIQDQLHFSPEFLNKYKMIRKLEILLTFEVE